MFDSNLLTAEFVAQAQQFGLNKEELINFCTKLNRIPSHEELAVCGALWSEHCSYKSSRVHLKRFHTEEPWVIQGPGENAGVIAINKNYGIAFKMESHNHPSYLEPYQGAATGVGGILRDVFCMGAYPIASLNCLRFGEGTWNAKLIRDTVRGIGDYGNSVGVPTVTGDISFHNKYSKNILVNAFNAGLIHKDKIFKGILSEETTSKVTNIEKIKIKQNINADLQNILFPESENVLIYFGSATGRDGVHGATMSSSEFSSTGNTLKPTVQVGDPFAEKVLLEATLSLIEKKLTIGLQDMGAAGLTSSSVEMAGRSGCGVAIDLNKVPQRASNMQAWEILLSESQERMLCAVKPENVSAVLSELEKFNITYAEIGKVNATGLFTCIFDNTIVTATPVPILVDETPKYNWPIQRKEEYLQEKKIIKNEATENIWQQKNDTDKLSLSLSLKNSDIHNDILSDIQLENLIERYPNLIPKLFAHPMNANRSPVFHNYCSTVQGNSVAACGSLQTASAGVVRLPEYAQELNSNGKLSTTGIAIAGGCEERWVELDPFHGSALTALKIARKLVASGAVPLAMTDCLNFGSPKSPDVMRQFSDAIDGINLIAKEMHIPIVSGNVSLNNQTEGIPIPPTPMLGMVGRVDDVNKVPLDRLPIRYFDKTKEKSIKLYHISLSNSLENSSYLASQTAWIFGGENSDCPKINISSEKNIWNFILKTIQLKSPKISRPIGHGGMLGSLISLALNSNCLIDLEKALWKKSSKELFSEGNMGFILGFKEEENFESIFNSSIHTDIVVTKIAELKPIGSNISMPIYDHDLVYSDFSSSLKKYFDTLSCAEKETK
ncbi:AIR synthase related protein [Pigmentibacter sp. JX0631]|uniref:AIR synthase related protein n=1 Tax=Pigmentibacter sp. JX0631 TaxID=2976982 RepID=UPI0024685B40|nr:AIR synthase related protein [Pigmentibacter sp. JX0631]WGL59411.1 AIR synthase related protein [Pigmentibacter sp. JX0631]